MGGMVSGVVYGWPLPEFLLYDNDCLYCTDSSQVCETARVHIITHLRFCHFATVTKHFNRVYSDAILANIVGQNVPI